MYMINDSFISSTRKLVNTLKLFSFRFLYHNLPLNNNMLIKVINCRYISELTDILSADVAAIGVTGSPTSTEYCFQDLYKNM